MRPSFISPLYVCLLLLISCKKQDLPDHPPLANAGTDISIVLPGEPELNGSASSDPDNNITGYLWTKVSGPSSYKITDPLAVKTFLKDLGVGIYQFELRVTDAKGLSSRDTVEITAITSNELLFGNLKWVSDNSQQIIHTNTITLPDTYPVSNIKNVYVKNANILTGTTYWTKIEKDGTTARVIYYHVDDVNNSILVYQYYSTQPNFLDLAFLPTWMKIEFN